LETDNKTLLVIVGPTAVGKTALSIQLAKEFDTEIISADSRQLFRELNIGTAKPTVAQLQEVKHHFINSHSITQDYDAAQFGHDALQVIRSLFDKHKFVILCGGSGLYVKAVCEGFDDIPEISSDIRQELIDQYNNHGLAWLQEKMRALDPDHLVSIDRHKPHRMIRALEVKIGTGKSIAQFRKSKKVHHDFNIIKIGLELPREELYHRIDARIDDMIGEGLFEEAKQLYHYRNANALQTVGYQEIFDFLDNRYDVPETIRLLKRNSRRYAKRQLTWFKRDLEITWFNPSQSDSIVQFIYDKK